MKQSGRFTQIWLECAKWVQEKKTFQYHGPDYVVVGMTRDEFERLYPAPKPTVYKDEYTIIDEVSCPKN